MARGRSGILRREDGTNTVELAFVLPLLLLMTFAVVDFARFMFEINGAHKAAQLGAALAVTRDPVALPVKDHFRCNTPANAALVGMSCRAPDGTMRPECDFGTVVCTEAGCDAGGTSYALGGSEASQAVFNAIVTRMRQGLPALQASQVEITYRPSDLGFVGRPIPVAEVSVAVRNVPFLFVALPVSPLMDIDNIVLPAQTVTFTSEDLSDNSCDEQGLREDASGACTKGSSNVPDPVCYP